MPFMFILAIILAVVAVIAFVASKKMGHDEDKRIAKVVTFVVAWPRSRWS